MVPAMLRDAPTWPELRQFGIGWWVRSDDTLRRLVEKVRHKENKLVDMATETGKLELKCGNHGNVNAIIIV
jgi:hypothetical protein